MAARYEVLDLRIATRKHPSASANPTSQWGSLISKDSISGLGIGSILGKAVFNTSVKPLFIEARMATIFRKPSIVRCSFLFINSTTYLNKIKSSRFFFFFLVIETH